jgi:hypothetical protein
MASIAMNVPRLATHPAAQEQGTPVESWLSNSDASIVLAGPAGTFALQAKRYSEFGSPGAGGGFPWLAVGPVMSAPGTYTLTGTRWGVLRLFLVSGDPVGITATLTTN